MRFIFVCSCSVLRIYFPSGTVTVLAVLRVMNIRNLAAGFSLPSLPHELLN